MIDITNQIHLAQTPKWNDFKKEYGGGNIKKTQDIYVLIKKMPFINAYLGYSPKVNFTKQKVDFKELKKFAQENNLSFIRFDIPNILENTKEGRKWKKILSTKGRKAPRNTFTQEDIILNLKQDLEEIMKNMHSKKRYNIRYAQKKGVKVKIGQTSKDLNDFWNLHSATAKRQMFLTHPKRYFEKIREVLKDDVYFVKAYVEKQIATVWMIIATKDTIYYAYGGSNPKFNKVYPNDLVGFEAIKLGKKLKKDYFDMWGAEKGKGFTEFKLKYGAEKVRFLDSFDIVYKPLPYHFFNIAYGLFWKAQDIKRFIKRKLGK